MLPRPFHLVRHISFVMARGMSGTTLLNLNPTPAAAFYSLRSSSRVGVIGCANLLEVSSLSNSSLFGRGFHALVGGNGKIPSWRGRVFAERREFSRKVRRKASRKKVNGLELDVSICIEEQLPEDPEILSIAEMLRLNVPMALKLALEGLKDSKYKTREKAIEDVSGFESVELSVMLCNDGFIRKLNKEWRNEDHATDVLSMSDHIPDLMLPVLMMGDIVISVETAARQANERGHSLLDEIRILVIHGLLHLLGFDHEISDEAETEMEKEEELILRSLGWKGKGLIQSAHDTESNPKPIINNSDDRKKEGSLRFYRPKFSYIFCDMDGTMLNSKSKVTDTTAKALKEALSRGIKVVVATGKTRPAVIKVLNAVGLAGRDGIISESSPGVFIQGLLVYGIQGREVFKGSLDPVVCKEACLYSLEHEIPIIAFSQDRCLTLFDHPLVDSLHTIYNEPKADIMPSAEQLVAAADIQKVIFLDTAHGVSSVIRPYWSEATRGRASLVQAQADMLEIVPPGTSKGSGVKMLLDHLGVTPDKVMAIGDGENDIEMLELASLGIAMSNGAEKTKAVADVIGVSNDEDGVADAIYRDAF